MGNVSPKHIVKFMCSKPNLWILRAAVKGLRTQRYAYFWQAVSEEVGDYYDLPAHNDAVRAVASFYSAQFQVWNVSRGGLAVGGPGATPSWREVDAFRRACEEAGLK